MHLLVVRTAGRSFVTNRTIGIFLIVRVYTHIGYTNGSIIIIFIFIFIFI